MNNCSGNHGKTLLNFYNVLYNAFGPQHWWPGDTPFEIAVGAILTQNTNWENVEKAIGNLKHARVLSCSELHSISQRKLAALIKPSGYFNVKAKRLSAFLDYISNHHEGSIKKMKKEETQVLRKELLDVKGIGPETADSILLYALEKPVFVIDAYTKRVLQRHHIIPENTTYHEMQKLFHQNLPRDIQMYNEYHALFVRVGKEFCKPKRRCERCPLKGI